MMVMMMMMAMMMTMLMMDDDDDEDDAPSEACRLDSCTVLPFSFDLCKKQIN